MNCEHVSKKQRYDVTECIICADTYTDPRQLPCLHTFCLPCIESLARDRRPGDSLACPLCRREFSLSALASSLPKDRFIGKMLMVRRLTSQVASHMQCDVCLRRGGRPTDAPTAKLYCVDCCDALCKPCSIDRSSCAGHELVKLRNRRPSRPEKFVAKLPATPCSRHPDEARDMFCVDCSVTACRRCLAADHKSHKAGEVEGLGARLRDHIRADVVRMQRSVARYRAELERLRQTRDEFGVR